MAVVMRITVPEMTPEHYDAVMEELDWGNQPRPEGMIAHYAWQGDGGWNVIDIWESEADFGRFAESHLGPAMAKATGGDPPPIQPQVATLHRYEHA